MRHAFIVAALGAILATGCLGQTPAAKMQETARDLNMNARFGRMELVVEQVTNGYKDEFVKRHRSWGTRVRVADAELVGLKYADTEAESMVSVSWYDVTEQELRGTVLRQKWKARRGDWLLDSEERVDGDVGLFGDGPPKAPPKPRETAQFPTIRIP
ncbi:MAG: hypothetical protein IPG50_35810 [Myxococcales bacterium]|nr:hypothetical protein [Myxococcales bacterium]